MPNVALTTVSTSTGKPVPASVYVNGAYAYGADAPAGSQVIPVVAGKTASVTAIPLNSDGNPDLTRTTTKLITGQNAAETMVIPDSLPSPATLNLEAPSNSSGVSVSLTGPLDAFGSPISKQGTTDDNGQLTIADLPPGDYSYSASHPNFQDLVAQPVSLAAGETQNVGMPMVSKDSPQASSGSLPTSDNGAGAAADVQMASLVDAQAQDAAFEQIYSNTSWNTYYTSAQCRVYIGELFIDELQAIQFNAPNNVVPGFGYASRFADFWADGKSLVQGQLILNYVSEAYMFTVLQTYRKKMLADAAAALTGTAKNTSDNAKQLANAVKAHKSLLAASAINASLLTAANTSNVADRIDTLAAGGPEVVRQAKQQLNNAGKDYTYMNAIYLPVAFDIRIEFGAGDSRGYRKLEKCKLTGNDQIIDQSGNVIADVYSFLARRVR